MTESNHIPVFYEGQDDLIDILATSMASVCYTTKSFIDFYILDCGICDFNKRQLENMKEKFSNFSIEFIPVDLAPFKGLRGWGPNMDSIDAYARLLIPDLKLDLKKVIYMDTDIIALDDIQKLYDVDLGDYPYAATPELGCDRKIYDNCVNNLGISPEHIYPSAGMLVLNLEKIQSSKDLIKVCQDYNDKLIVFNEEIFSITFGCNNYKRLDLRYNMADRINRIKDINAPEITDSYVEEEWKHIILQHLTPTKPWKYLYTEHNKPVRNSWAFWYFAKMTPFYEGMLHRYFWFASSAIVFSAKQIQSVKKNRKDVSFFGLPLLTIKTKGNKNIYKLFGLIPFLKIMEK